ncbi:MAG: FeoB-associated Cys-rich membrane protein [Candidatus Electrothrix sp. GW3-4]|uniref:FeoB-associated Cys-rich membrane protein n=1 Tax=Candidatus Electrothrix sp. GW3-4 TaxID=3126740 RepID=UPI0030D4572F
MQNLIVVLVVLVACLYVGRSLFRSYRSGTSSCPGGCSGCGKNAGSACSPQSEQQGEQD